MSIPTKEWFPKAHWLTDYPRSRLGSRSLPSDSVLRVESLECVRKNELSKDEISLLFLWSTTGGELSGLVTRDFEFSGSGEVQPVKSELQLNRLSDGDVLIVLLYERDTPPLEPHDPIGAISLFPNETYAVFPGDFRKPARPEPVRLGVGRPFDVLLDAGRDGAYRLTFHISREKHPD